MTEEDQITIEEDVIESMERSAEVYGLSRSAGRVYGVLYFADEPLSIPQLVEQTGYAKSTISNVTRKLTRIGLIRRLSSTGGGRRVQFEPETDPWFIIQDLVQTHIYREMTTSKRTLDRALDQLETLDGPAVERDRETIRELQGNYEQLQTLLQLATDHSMGELIEAIEQYEDEH